MLTLVASLNYVTEQVLVTLHNASYCFFVLIILNGVKPSSMFELSFLNIVFHYTEGKHLLLLVLNLYHGCILTLEESRSLWEN